ncbi:MAG: signal peptidase I [Clostridiales bacterium]|nr:signal peptidase I [Clostridiales bacterium]
MLYEDEILGKDAPKEEPPAKEPEAHAEKTIMARNALLLLRDIAVAFVVILVVLQFVKPTIVFEHSMEDTLHPEDYVFLAKQAYNMGEVEFGDIVVFSSTLIDDYGMQKNLIKRVIGLPGDSIEIKDEAVYRNGERLYEPYTREGVTEGEMDLVIVPKDSFFVLGDNRQQSRDSRSDEVGFISKEKLQGKVIFRLFPISHVGPIN